MSTLTIVKLIINLPGVGGKDLVVRLPCTVDDDDEELELSVAATRQSKINMNVQSKIIKNFKTIFTVICCPVMKCMCYIPGN